MHSHLDFGYPWWLSYGHLLVAVKTSATFFLAYRRHWPRWTLVLFGGLALWSTAAFLVVRLSFDVNARASLPTESFLPSGRGRVVDLGAGTGRSTIMVLEARPQTTVVALDLFSESFDRHFGREADPQQRLRSNLETAGVDQRAEIKAGDMRKLPFEAASFDAAVSSYAMDHLNREGVQQALAETARVVKPGGQFLLMVIMKEPWLQFTFGPLLLHSSSRDTEWWTTRVKGAGFTVQEQGIRPATLYILARRT